MNLDRNSEKNPTYVIITPARNEEAFIEKTIQSMVSQSVLPRKWVIVSDGSTDATDEIVKKATEKHSFIEFVSASTIGQRNFGSKVNAINAGYKRLKNTEYKFIGNLDADVSFHPNYFEMILKQFNKNSKMGIGGGIIQELINRKYVVQNISLNSVAGAVQLFRRKCYEDIGGYQPLSTGGVDAAAEIMARMKGWEVRTFPEFKVLHHRRVDIAHGNIFRSKFLAGIRDYSLGYHPIFYSLMCCYRVVDRPYIFGSLVRMFGYWWSKISRYERQLPLEVVKYLRTEQKQRLKDLFLIRRKSNAIKPSRMLNPKNKE